MLRRNAWYAVLEELAEAELQEAKLALDLVEAELDAHYRSTLEKVTETKISNKIKSSEEYIKAKVAVNEARKKVGILKAIREAKSRDIESHKRGIFSSKRHVDCIGLEYASTGRSGDFH